MNDESETEENKIRIGFRREPRKWIAPVLMLLLFGPLVIGVLWFIFVEEYQMRYQDWFMFGLYVLGTAWAAVALWQEWQKRRT